MPTRKGDLIFRRGMTVRVRVARGRHITARVTTGVLLIDGVTWCIYYERIDGAEKGVVEFVPGSDGCPVELISTQRGPNGGISAADRFWSKVDKSDADGCWTWTGNRVSSRYGMFKLDNKSMHASRASYLLNVGPIGDQSLQVCHRCDNPPCVRPDHLFLGTAQDNTDDAIRKGRVQVGRTVAQGGIAIPIGGPTRKLTPAQRLDIRRRREIGDSLTTLARAFNVSRTAIVKVCRM